VLSSQSPFPDERVRTTAFAGEIPPEGKAKFTATLNEESVHPYVLNFMARLRTDFGLLRCLVTFQKDWLG
jgi:hypothetical protein